MIICNEKCQIYNRCDCKNLRQRCIFDMGIIDVEEDERDKEIEKLMY